MKRRSMSGITERTRIKGMLMLILRGFAEAFPKRYASAMCPTANEVFCPLRSQTFCWRVIKVNGLWFGLGERQLQRNGLAEDWCHSVRDSVGWSVCSLSLFL